MMDYTHLVSLVIADRETSLKNHILSITKMLISTRDKNEGGSRFPESAIWQLGAPRYTSESATSIILVNDVWRCSEVVISPVRMWSEMVRIPSALLPLRAAFM